MKNDKNKNKALSQTSVMQSVILPNELRIGNFIEKKGDISVLASINTDSTIRIYNDDKTDTWGCFSLRIFNPIQINEEWLAKLGYDLISENHYGVLGHLIWKIEGRFYCDKNGIQLKYVHQLQNLYFALTGSELTVA